MAHQQTQPVQEYSKELQRYISYPHWDAANQAYYRKHHYNNQWVFLDWMPSASSHLRTDSGTATLPLNANVQTSHDSGQAAYSSQGRQGQTIVGSYTAANPHPREALDPDFEVRRSSFFKEGIVIAILFTEAAGNTTKNYNSAISYVSYGQPVYTQIRRFIVVGLRHGFCFACPIFTYGNQGTKKPGVLPQEHAIAYSQGFSPTLLHGEEELSKEPICVVMRPKERPLSKASRVCFGIHHPIQFNVKVKHIGDVETSEIPTLLGYWKMENAQFASHPAEADIEASEKKSDPFLYSHKKNRSGYDAEKNPYAYHPKHNPFGYHPDHNPHGFHIQEKPYAYHPRYNEFGFNKDYNDIGYHPKKNAYGYHPDKNPHGFHPTLMPFCYHPEQNPEGYHSRDNPRGYHPVSNRYCYHSVENPEGFHPEQNPYGYHEQLNPYGYHPSYSPRGYHPTRNPSAYHPRFQPIVAQQVVSQQSHEIVQGQAYEDDDSSDEEGENESDNDEEDEEEDPLVVI